MTTQATDAPALSAPHARVLRDGVPGRWASR